MKSYQSVGLALVLGAIFFSGFIFAGEVEITEQIRGKLAETSGTAVANFSAACEAWEKTARDEMGTKLIYSSCGGEETSPFNTRYVVTECYTQVTENGQTYEVCGPEWKDNAAYAQQTFSMGKLLVNVDGTAGQLDDAIAGDATACAASKGKECFAARAKAFESFQARCQAFKEKAKTSFAARLLYASCGEPKNVANSSAVDKFQYRSKATIYYQK